MTDVQQEKHTPGPWKPGGSLILSTGPITGVPIARVLHNLTDEPDAADYDYRATCDMEEFNANAALVSAAPHMLECLKRARTLIEQLPIDDRVFSAQKECAILALNDGIRAARG